MHRQLALVSCLLAVVACATPSVAPLAVTPIKPGAKERVVVTHSYLIVDSSESVQDAFASQKALVQSFVAAQPSGDYQAGGVVFGGFKRQTQPLEAFDRSRLSSNAAAIERLREGTPLDRVFGEVAEDLRGKSGHAAVVVFSDGRPTDPIGREIEEQSVLDAAARLTTAYQGEVCIHTVQAGDDAAGAVFLRRLSETTDCGSARTAGSVMNVASLQGMERDVYFGAALPDVAAAPPGRIDSDGDGVLDGDDQCPNTPSGVKVDARGCWVLNVHFAFDSAVIEPKYYDELNRVAARLKEVGPGAIVRVDGHTDSVGSEAYNQGLSQRRAQAVRDYLVQQGVPESQLQAKGFGASQPAASNDGQDGRALNRRTELSRL
jgi:OOP family OmpA-OmpF porin